ncbi:MAG TPA: hypothetical protein VFU36_13495, partial [Jatrophihabitans sp.]|nr:hypothetical protein [Jatrophihabitans sp.]
MTIEQLYAALQPFQDTAAGTLTVPASAVTDWTGVHALLVAALAEQTLLITGITEFPPPPTSNAISYLGSATLFPWPDQPGDQTVLAVTATFSVDQAGEPQLLIRATAPTPPAWRLSDSLAGLSDTDLTTVEFTAALFLLTSTPVIVSDYAGTVQPFIALAAELAATGPYALSQPLLATAGSRQLQGPVSLTEGEMPVIALEPVGAAPITLAGVDARFGFGATVASYYQTVPYYDPDDPDVTSETIPVSTAGLQASMAFGVGPPLVFELPVLPVSRFATLSVTATRPLASWAELDQLVPGVDLAAAIPPEVPAANSLVLQQFSLSLYFPDGNQLPTVNSVVFDVAMQTGDWPLLPNDILTLQAVGAALTVLFPGGLPQVTGYLYSDFTIVDELVMTATLGIPRLALTAELSPGETASVESLMAAVMQKLT